MRNVEKAINTQPKLSNPFSSNKLDFAFIAITITVISEAHMINSEPIYLINSFVSSIGAVLMR